MAIRNAKLGGTDYATGEVLYDYDLDDTNNALVGKEYADNTGGSALNNTAETDVATITITQNDLNDSATLIINSGILKLDPSSSITTTFRLYVGGSVVKTIVMDTGHGSSGTSFNYMATGIDSTAGNVIVKVTAQNNTAVSFVGGYCYGLTVRGYNR